MVKLYEVLKDIKPLTYTDYYVEVPSSTCLKGYDHNYITKHKVHNIRRLTNKDKYEYVVQSSICNDISNTNDFINCLSSCAPSNPTTSYPCPATLQPTAVISLSNNINTSTSLNNLTIRVNKDAYFTNGLSNEDWIGLEIYGGTQINFNSLDICGVNLNIHDNISEMLSPPLSCNNDLIIREGNHIFNNNNYQGIDKGGVISANKISLIDASITFRKNYSITSSGGAIYAEQNLTISGDGTNIQFHDNSASSGGAIYTPDSGNIYITNISNSNMIKFYNNDASWSGGAIRTGSLTIQNISGNGVDFSNNMTNLLSTGSGGQGGAIYTKNYTNLTNSNIKFKHNLSTMGGAIHSDGSIVIIIQNDSKNLLFYDNNVSSLSKSPLITARGGAINTGSLTIKNMTNDGHVTFLNNKAINIHPDTSSGIGGAIAASKDINLKDANITFRNNYADNCGGAIYTDSSLSINGDKTNLLFHDNSAQQGGAIYMDVSSILKINHTIPASDFSFLNNFPTAIYFDSSSHIIECPSFNNITCAPSGEKQCKELSNGIQYNPCNDISDANGFIYCLSLCIHKVDSYYHCPVSLKPKARITLNNDIFHNNMNLIIRSNNDAYFTNGESNEDRPRLEVSGARIGLHSLDICGVNLSVYNNNIYIKHSALNCSSGLIIREGIHSFYRNRTDGDGGVIYASDISFINASITFWQNYSTRNGGAIYANKSLTIIDASITFKQNKSEFGEIGGGAIYANESLTISGNKTDILFDNNKANKYGGAIAGVYMNLIDSKIQFLDNDASSSGGAIFTKVNLTISGDKTNLIFHDNNAAGKGGAIYMNGGAWLTINHTISVSNIDFSRNNPDAIYFNPNSEIIECPSFNTINCEPSRSIQCTHLSGGVLGNS